MAKREYRKDGDARKVVKTMRLSKAEANKLASVAEAVGMNDSELARNVLLKVLGKFESTGVIELGGEVITIQPALFGNITKTTKVEAGVPA